MAQEMKEEIQFEKKYHEYLSKYVEITSSAAYICFNNIPIKLIFWQQNGEVKHDNPLVKRFFHAKRKKILLEWNNEEIPGVGFFKNTLLYLGKTKTLFVEREWKPAFGYSWSEIQIYILK
jgi:hypothetical protein